MDLCKSVFDFEEFGIKPHLKDIKNDNGCWILEYLFLDQEYNIFRIFFYYNAHFRFCVYVDEQVGYNRYKFTSIDNFYVLINDAGCFNLRSIFHSGLNILKG